MINAATKNGTNELHGSFYDFLGNDAFNSRSFTSGPTKGKLRYNMFGATVGGPVWVPGYNGKDKTFFFFAYEGIRQPSTQLVSGSRPLTAAMKQGDFSALSTPIIDPVTRQSFPGNRIPSDRLNAFTKFVADKMPLASQCRR